MLPRESQEVQCPGEAPASDPAVATGPSAPPGHVTSSSGIHPRPQLARGIIPDYPGSIVSSSAGFLSACCLTAHATVRISLVRMRREDHGHFCSLPGHRGTHRVPQTLGMMWTLHSSCSVRTLTPDPCSRHVPLWTSTPPKDRASLSTGNFVTSPSVPKTDTVSPSKRLHRIHIAPHPESPRQALSLLVLKADPLELCEPLVFSAQPRC